ncbi:MAG: ATP-binding cassette domain-containing protein [Betaproteobacteria bacterium]|nr:ATP-binding cassette domain-containing protein [Betaproteobacteria bacterium]
MSLLTLQGGRLAFGHVALLDDAALSIDAGERIALIGRNGTGKSSLLKALAGQIALDDGRIVRRNGCTLAHVAQEPVFDAAQSVHQAVAAALPDHAELIDRHQRIASALAGEALSITDQESLTAALAAVQTELETTGAWTVTHRIDSILSKLGLAPDAIIGNLSGGTRKRVALGRALVAEPDLLLLDEPTNHLDIESISWLEDLLAARREATLLITHDRRLMDRVATRIIELDRGVLRSYPGSFAAYQRRKADELAQEAVVNAKFDRLLAQEEVWIRQGVEARRTRNEGRVRRLESLRRAREQRRERVGRVRIEIDSGERSGKLVAELTGVGKAWGNRWVVRELDCVVSRGDRVGLIGPNGAGKTTLIKLILGELAADEGQVRRGTQLEVAYFDQMREQLDEDASLIDTISPGSDWIEMGGQRTHVMSYLGRFLFAPERARSPVKSLSGGERNRLLLARLFARATNLLVLDEPTNDLDIETLELLEELLAEYSGTVLLVSHDRAFLDAVVTQSIAHESDGRWLEYAGGYSDIVAARERQAQASAAQGAAPAPASVPRAAGETTQAASTTESRAANRSSRSRLSYKEQRELEALPAQIDALEAEQAQLAARLSDPTTYREAGTDARALAERHAAIETELAQCLVRWEALEARTAG